MSMRTDTVRAKVSHETKVAAEKVLKNLGLSTSDAINLMLIQVKMRKALPFEIAMPSKPNAETLRAMDETDEGKGLIECDDEEDLFKKIGI